MASERAMAGEHRERRVREPLAAEATQSAHSWRAEASYGGSAFAGCRHSRMQHSRISSSKRCSRRPARTREILDVDTCAVLLLDEETDELVARAAVGIEEEVERGVRIPVGGGFRRPRGGQRRPVVLDDVDHADVLNPLLREKGIKSLLGVPLLVADEVLGVLHVGIAHAPRVRRGRRRAAAARRRPRGARDRARAAFEAERRRAERLENVQAVTDAALAHLELDDLLAVLLAAHPRHPRGRHVRGSAARRRTQRARRPGCRRDRGGGRARRPHPGRRRLRRPRRRRARPVILDDVDHADVLNPILREKGIKSLLGVPLLVARRA